MNDTFVYVFSEADRDVFAKLGLKFLYKHQSKDIWVFVDNTQQRFSAPDTEYVVGNCLTF